AWPGQHVTAVAIEDTAYKPGKECEILYSLQFADPVRGQSRWVAVTFANENKLGKIYRHYSGGDAVAQPTPCPVVCLPAYGSLAVEMAQVQNVLHTQAAARGLIIPKPLKVIEEWGLLLMERVPGTSMRPRVKQGRAPQQLTEVIGLAAAALASLHRLRFESQE